MQIKNSIKVATLSVVTSVLLVGCGGGSDSTSTTKTGTFADAPVQGLHYETATQKGITDASGHFKYLAGEDVEFKLGNLSLGKGKAGAFVTPYTISDNNTTATNIALLLQNFDGNRSNGNVLDVSKLKDYNFTSDEINLSASSSTLKGKIETLFADNSFASFRDDSNNSVIDATTVKNSMDNYIKNSSLSSAMVGKSFIIVKKSNMFGYQKDDSITFTSTTMNITHNTEKLQVPYTIEEGYIKLDWRGIYDDTPTEYIAITNQTADKISSCSDNKTLEDAKKCTVPDSFLLTPNKVDSFVQTQNASSNAILKNRTLVTNFSEIQNKDLYELDSWGNHINIEKIKIDADGNYSSQNFDANSHYHGTFSNGTLHVTGFDQWDQEHEGNGTVNETYAVYKYNLAGTTIPAKEFTNEDIFDDDGIATMLPNTNFTFTSGNMYCHILWSECWVDEDAITQMQNQLPQQ